MKKFVTNKRMIFILLGRAGDEQLSEVAGTDRRGSGVHLVCAVSYLDDLPEYSDQLQRGAVLHSGGHGGLHSHGHGGRPDLLVFCNYLQSTFVSFNNFVQVFIYF